MLKYAWRGWAWVLVLFTASVTSQLHAGEHTSTIVDSISRLSYSLVYVNTFGEWRKGGAQGVYRVVLLDSSRGARYSLMFIQLIESKNVDGKWLPSTVVKTVPVDEINMASVFHIENPKTGLVGAENEPVVEVLAVNQYTKSVLGFRIVPMSSGRYRFSSTSVPVPSGVGGMPVIANQIEAIPATFEYYMRPTF